MSADDRLSIAIPAGGVIAISGVARIGADETIVGAFLGYTASRKASRTLLITPESSAVYPGNSAMAA